MYQQIYDGVHIELFYTTSGSVTMEFMSKLWGAVLHISVQKASACCESPLQSPPLNHVLEAPIASSRGKAALPQSAVS